MLVELSHPALGTQQTVVRDISTNGLFVALQNPSIGIGAKVKLRQISVLPTDTQPKPTVELEVRRVAENGLGLAFINKTSHHLWNSAQRLRSELQIGRDYFQVHQSAAVQHPAKGVLLVQQNGKWLLPGRYLLVGENATTAIKQMLEQTLSLQLQSDPPRPLAVDSAPDVHVDEAASYSVAFHLWADSPHVELSDEVDYRDWKWVNKMRDVSEYTFALQWHKQVIGSLLAADPDIEE